MADSLAAVRGVLQTLRPRFRRIFYTPGNHELWRQPGTVEQDLYPDSFAKLFALRAVCDELGVDCVPGWASPDVLCVPLMSWYNDSFDGGSGPGAYRFDRFCAWPVAEAQVWQVLLKMNEPLLASTHALLAAKAAAAPSGSPAAAGAAAGGCGGPPAVTIVSMSHFLPRRELPFSPFVPDLAKAVGCPQLELQLEALVPPPPAAAAAAAARESCYSCIHCYGHSHHNTDVLLPRGGSAPSSENRLLRRYVQYAVDGLGTSAGLYFIYDSSAAGQQQGPAAAEAPATAYVVPLNGDG